MKTIWIQTDSKKRIALWRYRIHHSLALAALAAGTLFWRAAAQDTSFEADTHLYLSRLEKLGFAGVVLVARNGVPIHARGYGLADRERGLRWNPATVSTIGSITKQFTAAAILSLEEAGRLRTSDSITNYFADVPPEKRGITIHQLLTHSSGILDIDADDWDPIGREEFIRRALSQPLAFPPGTGYEYSNAGYSLLGAIIEQLTGDSWERYVRAHLFLPRGMYETGYILPEWGQGRLAQGYRAGERWGTVVERPMDKDGPYWVLRANGGIHTNAWDMLRWVEALRTGRVLSATSMEKLWHPWVDEGGGESFYGYGWVVMDYGSIRIITHNGGNRIHFADLAIVPSLGLVIFVQTNVIADFPGAEDLLRQIGGRFIAGTPYPVVPDVNPQPDSALQSMAGRYQLPGRAGILQIEATDGTITAEAEGPGAFHILHSSRVVDSIRAGRLIDLTHRFMDGWRQGDMSAIRDRQSDPVTIDRLAEGLTAWVANQDSTMGALQGFQVLGAALRETGEMVVVRFRFEQGSTDRTYVWSLEEEPVLLGRSRRGVPAKVMLVPTGAGQFETWDGGLTHSRRMRFGDGRLTIDGAGESVTATR